MPADHLGELETVEIGHADIDKHNGDVGLQQRAERFARRIGFDQVLAQLAEDHLVAQELRGLVVNEQNVDWLASTHRCGPSDAATCAARPAAARCSPALRDSQMRPPANTFPGPPSWPVSYTHLTLPTNREV